MRQLFIISLGLLAASPSLASEDAFGDQNLAIAGAEVSGHHSAYGLLGAITPLPGSTLGNGFVARLIASGLTYQYEGAPGDVDGTAFGGEASIGYQGSDAGGWWGIYAGPGYRYTHLSPDDRTSDARGSNYTLNLQAEVERNVTQNVKTNLTGSYAAFGNNAYWTRARLLERVSGSIFVGPEAGLQGDDDYRAWQLGAAVTGIEVNSRASLGVKAGVRKAENFSASPYGGLELGVKF